MRSASAETRFVAVATALLVGATVAVLGTIERYGLKQEAPAAEVSEGDHLRALAGRIRADRTTGHQAARELGRSTDADPATLRELARDPEVAIRANAIRALAGRIESGDVAWLGAALADPATPWRVRQEAARALGKPGADDAVPFLAAALAEEGSDPLAEGLRIAAIRSLGAVGTDAARSVLAGHRSRRLGAIEKRILGAASAGARADAAPVHSEAGRPLPKT